MVTSDDPLTDELMAAFLALGTDSKLAILAIARTMREQKSAIPFDANPKGEHLTLHPEHVRE